MNEPVTEAELARVLELDAKATPGPWKRELAFKARIVAIQDPIGPDIARCEQQLDPRTDCDNAALIAEYRTLTPRLARELAAARAAIKELEHSLEIALKGKRPFTPKLADEVISCQVKQITKLQDELAAIREWTPAIEYNDPTSRFHLKAWRLRTASGRPVWEQPPTTALTQLNTHTHE